MTVPRMSLTPPVFCERHSTAGETAPRLDRYAGTAPFGYDAAPTSAMSVAAESAAGSEPLETSSSECARKQESDGNAGFGQGSGPDAVS